MADVEITVTRNGPYYVKGPVKLVDHRGNEIPYEGDEVWLCRCGGSQTKPFCDGTHKRIGFQGGLAAPHEATSESS